MGAATADELAVKTNRAGDDITPDLESLRKRNLVMVKPRERGGEKYDLDLTSRGIRDLL